MPTPGPSSLATKVSERGSPRGGSKTQRQCVGQEAERAETGVMEQWSLGAHIPILGPESPSMVSAVQVGFRVRASWAIWGGPIPSHGSVGVDTPPWLGQREVVTEGQRQAELALRMEEEATGQGMRKPREAGKDKAPDSPAASKGRQLRGDWILASWILSDLRPTELSMSPACRFKSPNVF